SYEKDDVSLTFDEANNFMHPLIISKRGLYEECYGENCDFEEVEEVLGRTKAAYEYYYTFTCKTFRKNCQVTCHYRKDCSFGNWGSWSGGGNRGGECVTQTRYRPYNNPIQTIKKRWNCNGLHISCPDSPSETRVYCNCKKAVCTLGTWSVWTGEIPQGTCATQSRHQTYKVSWSTEAKVGSCQDVNKKCKDPVVDLRKRCSCKKAICSLRNWSKWSGSARPGECATQTRTRSYDKSIVYEQRRDCSDVRQDCPAPTNEQRNFCDCRYATCALGEWTEWNPKVLRKGVCGQRQSRRKTYEMSLAYQDHVDSCPSLPQKCLNDVVETRQQCMCAFRDSCTVSEWSKWSEDVTEEGCKIQTRTKAYVSPLKHAQGDHCKGLNTECIEEPQETRTFCKCKYVKCKLGNWNEWSDLAVSAGSCGEQTRTQSYTAKEVFIDRVGDCNALPTICPADKQEKRYMCKCKTVKCEVGDWSGWQGDIPIDTCAFQERRKFITTTNQVTVKANSCEGVATTCGEPPNESRKMCNCSYRHDCTLKDWGPWNGDVPDVGCAVQIRTRDYNNSINHVEQESCNGLDVCPVIRDETRTKCNCNQVICEWTDWLRESFDPETNCYQKIRVKNKSAGLQKLERIGSCDEIQTICSNKEIERHKECVSGGGGRQIITSPPPAAPETTLAPTTEFKPATYVSLGCFTDHHKDPRPLPLLYLNIRSEIDWHDLTKTVQACAEEAKKKRLQYFGVQFYGECWGGPHAAKTYNHDGPSKKCYKGVGAQYTNAVYRLENMPACSNEMSFTAKVSSGAVSEGVWCAGNSNKYQWIVVNVNGAKKISGIGTQGGNKDSWVTLYSLEYSEDGESWLPYKEEGATKVFAGNSDRFTLENYWLKYPLNARFLRFKPKSWSSTHVCMKVRLYGCDV
ncbi:hypothetical protein QZH41_008363, partial [Actinostola sp. cb2023]